MHAGIVSTHKESKDPSSPPSLLSSCIRTLRSNVHDQHGLLVLELLAQVVILAAGILHGEIVHARTVHVGERKKEGRKTR